ncbi:hypothetical protein [Kistimonas asteriae]|uniref:hypothetical protein n=1 Tax=Kistimonas asteriae TaxID=517724 RepID=UPI001BAAD4B0|nr:hypothetical protein [Kistimonas asteriae]
MSKSLYHELKRIGIDEELAHNVDKALDPAHVATKEDMVILQEAIQQTQVKVECRYLELRNAIDRLDHLLSTKIDLTRGDIKTQLASVACQFRITLGGLITTILSVFLVNGYFHAMPV